MSYILDALKKSEQQRGHGNIPDVQTVHSAGLNYRSEKRVLWPYILVAAVLLNFAAIVYFIYDRSYLSGKQHADDSFRGMQRLPVSADQEAAETLLQQASAVGMPAAETEQRDYGRVKPEVETLQDTARRPAPEAQAGATSSQAAISLAPVSQMPASQTPVSQTPASQPPVTQATTAPEASPAEDHVSGQIIPYYDLPESISSQLPAIIISAHVYSSNPRQRSIVINNNFMEEGEYVIDDLILHEITSDGAIFNYHGTLFSYGVVSSWQ